MDLRKIVVVVEDVEVARRALEWALNNLLRLGDLITLLHVFSPTTSSSARNKKRIRSLRLKGYQLALSFKDICNKSFFNTNVEIIVTQGDQQGTKIAAMVAEIGASLLVLGLHQNSFLYQLAMAQNNMLNNLQCKVLAIKQPTSPPPMCSAPHISTNLDLSQIEIAGLQVPEVPPPKIMYRICPDPYAIIWRRRPRTNPVSSTV